MFENGGRTIIFSAVVFTYVFMPSRSQADESENKLQLTAIAGALSDYVYRGVSLNDEKPTPLIWAEMSYGPIYINGLLIGTELGTDGLGRDIGTLEADATVGLRASIGKADFNLGAKYTGYPNGRDLIFGTLEKAERDFIEPFAAVTVNATNAMSFTATVYHTPDFYYETGAVSTIEAQANYQLPAFGAFQPKFTALAGHAHSENRDIISPGHGYWYWNAGVEVRVERLIFDLRYWDTDVEGIDGYEQRVVFGAGIVLN